MTLKLIFLLTAVLFASISTFAQPASGPNPKALQALTRGDFPGAISILDQDIADGKNLFESYRFRAEVKRMMGQFPGSLADVNKAIEIKSDDGRLYETRAQLRMFMRASQEEILKDLDLAISNGLKHEKVFGTRGMIRMSSGDPDGAIADYQTAIGLNPNDAQSYVGLSSAYRQKGDNDKAIEVLENFVSTVEGSSKKVEALKGEIAAVATVDTPLRKGESGITGQDTVVYKEDGKFQGPMTPEAAQRMAERMTNTKNTALAYINLAQMYEKQELYQKAIETVEKGLAIDPSSYFGMGIRGTIRVRLKDYSRAIEDLSQALRINQRFADLFLYRGIAYLILDRNSEAEGDFAKFLEIVPKGQERLNQMKAAALAEKGGN